MTTGRRAPILRVPGGAAQAPPRPLRARHEGRLNAADLDGSGEVDLDEFFNCFRTDSFPRDTFFWSKVRPRPLLGRMERVRLAQNLLAGAVIKDWTQDEIMEVVQQKVEQFSAKAIFNSLDDNRSGRVNVREFVGAMREMDIMISDEKCEQLFKDLNERVGETDRTSHISYLAFANAFHEDARGISGDDAGVVKQKGERRCSAGSRTRRTCGEGRGSSTPIPCSTPSTAASAAPSTSWRGGADQSSVSLPCSPLQRSWRPRRGPRQAVRGDRHARRSSGTIS